MPCLKYLLCYLFLTHVKVVLSHFCQHGDDNISQYITHHVNIESIGSKKRKRHLSENLKIHISYDATLNNLPEKKRTFIKTKVLPEAVNYWRRTLLVPNSSSNIKLLRQCKSDKVRYEGNIRGRYGYKYTKNHTNHAINKSSSRSTDNDNRIAYCFEGCSEQTYCGDVRVPEDHLESCRRISKKGSFISEGVSGKGLEGVHFILYASAENTKRCSVPDTVAYAAYCRLERLLDRPVAGYVNICPGEISTRAHDYHHMLYTIKHEILHALGFSSSLFAFYRDKSGNPLSPRIPATNKPRYDNQAKRFMWSEKVVETVLRHDWLVGDHVTNRTLHYLVTPRVVEEVRAHFGCPNLRGAELEDQGSLGTSLTHWEKRLFENELMTGTYTQNLVVSRITLALLDDTGWYSVNYSMAGSLEWGRGLGCEFAENSCSYWMQQQNKRNESIHPYCTHPKSNLSTTQCSEDRDAVGICNLVQYSKPLLPQYRHFTSLEGVEDASWYGGAVSLADYCPYVQEFNWKDGDTVVRGSKCILRENNPIPEANLLLETYGQDSKCFEHPWLWSVQDCHATHQVQSSGSACYKYTCDYSMHRLGVMVGGALMWCPSGVANQNDISHANKRKHPISSKHRHFNPSIQFRHNSPMLHTSDHSAIINVSITTPHWLHRGSIKCVPFHHYCKDEDSSPRSSSSPPSRSSSSPPSRSSSSPPSRSASSLSSLDQAYSTEIPCNSASSSPTPLTTLYYLQYSYFIALVL